MQKKHKRNKGRGLRTNDISIIVKNNDEGEAGDSQGLEMTIFLMVAGWCYWRSGRSLIGLV